MLAPELDLAFSVLMSSDVLKGTTTVPTTMVVRTGVTVAMVAMVATRLLKAAITRSAASARECTALLPFRVGSCNSTPV